LKYSQNTTGVYFFLPHPVVLCCVSCFAGIGMKSLKTKFQNNI